MEVMLWTLWFNDVLAETIECYSLAAMHNGFQFRSMSSEISVLIIWEKKRPNINSSVNPHDKVTFWESNGSHEETNDDVFHPKFGNCAYSPCHPDENELHRYIECSNMDHMKTCVTHNHVYLTEYSNSYIQYSNFLSKFHQKTYSGGIFRKQFCLMPFAYLLSDAF